MIELQHIIETKRELLSRETYSRNPINYSEGMAEDQKDRYRKNSWHPFNPHKRQRCRN